MFLDERLEKKYISEYIGSSIELFHEDLSF
jgi:hypothetical protein